MPSHWLGEIFEGEFDGMCAENISVWDPRSQDPNFYKLVFDIIKKTSLACINLDCIISLVN